jgi:hypothetical protein
VTTSSTSGSQAGIWLSLDSILSLPLEPNALAVLWLEILRQQPMETNSNQQQSRQRILAALHELEINRALETCRRGEWSSGLSRLERAMEICDFQAMVAPGLLEILPELHYQLVDLAEESPSRCPFCDAERAELFWSSAQWLRRLNDHGIEQPARMAAIHEQIYRYGALAWIELDSPLACSRSLTLLLALSEMNSAAISWTWPACRARLSAQLQAMEDVLINDESLRDVGLDLEELIQTIEWFAVVFSGQLSHGYAQFSQELAEAKRCLLVWQKLKSDS